MPRLSKIRPPGPKPGDAPKPKEELSQFRCSRCGKIFKRQRDNFPNTQSPLFRGNGGYLPVCNVCLEDLFQHYKDVLSDEKEAIKRMCIKFDIYWNPELYAMIDKTSTTRSRIKAYISKTNLLKYIGKTYDDTLDENKSSVHLDEVAKMVNEYGADETILGRPVASPVQVTLPDKETILFWGSGFTPEFYNELNLRYERWTAGLQKPLDPGEEALYKQICIAEATINRNIAIGKNVEQAQNALNNLLGSLNIKPNQKKDEEDALGVDSTPLGVWAKRWEDKRPIPDDDPDLADSYGVVKYISTWLYGHLSKMLGIKSIYSKLYEDEIAKFRVDRPEFEGEDDEEVFDSVFNSDGGEDT